MSQHEDHLRLLSIFHFVLAGLSALFSLFPILHLTIGVLMASGALTPGRSDPAAPIVGGILAGFAGVMILAGLTFAVLQLLTGRALAARRRYTLCLVVAALECLALPFGTVLGIFTLIVLVKPEVKQLFGVDVPPPGRPA